MIVSFDFDGTLTIPEILEVAKNIKHYKIITTSRHKSQEVIDFMKKHNFNAVQFTKNKPKYKYLQNVNIHVDNNKQELNLIIQNSNCIPIHINDIDDIKSLL